MRKNVRDLLASYATSVARTMPPYVLICEEYTQSMVASKSSVAWVEFAELDMMVGGAQEGAGRLGGVQESFGLCNGNRSVLSFTHVGVSPAH